MQRSSNILVNTSCSTHHVVLAAEQIIDQLDYDSSDLECCVHSVDSTLYVASSGWLFFLHVAGHMLLARLRTYIDDASLFNTIQH